MESIYNLLKNGAFQEALPLIEEALMATPEDHALLVYRGIALNRCGRAQEAFDSYTKALAINPNDADAWFNRGACVRGINAKDMHAEGLRSYEMAVKADRGCVDAWMNLGNVTSRIGMTAAERADAAHFYAESEKAYRTALETEPQNGDLLYNMGVLRVKEQRLDEALAYMDRAIAANADAANCRYGRGYVLLLKKDYAGAITAFRESLALDAQSFEAIWVYTNLGAALLESGNPQAAIDAWQAATKLRPPVPPWMLNKALADVYFNIALALRRRSDEAGSSAAYEQSLDCRRKGEMFYEPALAMLAPAARSEEHIVPYELN